MTRDKMIILDANGDPKYEIDENNNIIDLREFYCTCDRPEVQSIKVKIKEEIVCEVCGKLVYTQRRSC